MLVLSFLNLFSIMNFLLLSTHFSFSQTLSSSLLSISKSLLASYNLCSWTIFSISALIVLNSLYYSTLNLYSSVPTGILEIIRMQSISYAFKLINVLSSSVKSTPRTSFIKKNSFFRLNISQGSFYFLLSDYCAN